MIEQTYRRIAITIEGAGTYEFHRTVGFEGIISDDYGGCDVSMNFTVLLDPNAGALYRFTKEKP